jgi:hypothetical protein
MFLPLHKCPLDFAPPTPVLSLPKEADASAKPKASIFYQFTDKNDNFTNRKKQTNIMFEQTFKNIDDILHKDAGCGSELDYVEQTVYSGDVDPHSGSN